MSPPYERSDYIEEQTLLFDPVQTQSAVVKEPQSDSSDERTQLEPDRIRSVVTEPNSDPDQHVKAVDPLYSCTICGTNFKMSADLKRHMRTHTGKKPYSCKFCKKEFAFSSSVSRHMRVHTGEKPYECPLCGKRFNVSTTLKVHYRIHMGERPYKCKTCERSFTTCSNLKKHVALHNKAAESKPVQSCHLITDITENHNELV
ncbi:zinc finger protein 846-like isoform X11 [Scomber scombrus]|uniref:Zinc finger protein 846-like isoform X11 n=2 Tax=Scomber scombrus TaxID=13677 RepID=A0AAV1MUV8_SCOSC